MENEKQKTPKRVKKKKMFNIQTRSFSDDSFPLSQTFHDPVDT